MKKIKFAISVLAIATTCSVVGVSAVESGWINMSVNSLNATTVTSRNKSTNVARMGATLTRQGDPDTIIFYAHSSSGSLYTNFDVTESSSWDRPQTSNEAVYYAGSGTTGTYVRAAAQSRDFSVGGFPITTKINFY